MRKQKCEWSLSSRVQLYYSRFSPDDRWIAFNAVRGTDLSTIYVVPAAGGEWTRITEEKAGLTSRTGLLMAGYFTLSLIAPRDISTFGDSLHPVSGKPVASLFKSHRI